MPGPVTIVTGAYGAVGRAVAQVFAERGARVVGIARSSTPPADVAPHLRLALGADLTKADEAARCIADVQAALGGVDVLVNIAGGFRWEKLEGGAIDTWRAMFDMNAVTAANMCKAAVPALRASGRGRIINVGAGAALNARAGMGPYAASKAAVHSLTQALSDELKGAVTVNAVLPSTIDTPQNREDMPDAKFETWVTPREIAEVMWFLASREAGGLTGALIPVVGRT